MKTKKGTRALSVLLALLLVSLVIVPAVSAKETVEQVEPTIIEDPEGMEVVRYSHVSSNSILDGREVIFEWRAGTNIWHKYTDIYSDHYSKSRNKDTGYPYDIDTIGVRGRVWEDDDPRLDQTVTNHQSADATINYETTGSALAHWYARSDHTFEYPANNEYWYPMTEDEFNE